MPKQGRPTKAAMEAETMEDIDLEAPLPGEEKAKADPDAGLPLDDPRVQEMEIELRTLYQESNRDLISNVVKIGKYLMKAKELIIGRYHEWLPRTGISQSTASRYVRISRFVTANPEINRWKELV